MKIFSYSIKDYIENCYKKNNRTLYKNNKHTLSKITKTSYKTKYVVNIADKLHNRPVLRGLRLKKQPLNQW